MMRPEKTKELPGAPKQKKKKKQSAPGTKSSRGGGAAGQKGLATWLKWVIVIGIIALIVTFSILGLFWAGVIKLSIAPGGPSTSYSISISDGALNKELQTTGFTYSVYGTNSSLPLTNSTNMLISATKDLATLTVAAVQNAILTKLGVGGSYTTLWVEYHGYQLPVDAIYGVSNERGTRFYGTRWAQLSLTTANSLVTYETPNLVGFVVAEAANISHTIAKAASIAATVVVGYNVTMIIANNVTQTTAMYVPYYNPMTATIVQMNIVTIFNHAITSGDFMVNGDIGTVGTLSTTQPITYDLGALMAGTEIVSGTWNTFIGSTLDAPTTGIVSFTLNWGTTALVVV